MSHSSAVNLISSTNPGTEFVSAALMLSGKLKEDQDAAELWFAPILRQTILEQTHLELFSVRCYFFMLMKEYIFVLRDFIFLHKLKKDKNLTFAILYT